jgi:hypothetical protein
MSFNKDAVKEPFAGVPTTDAMCGWIGKVAITWSELELRLDEMISALLKGTSTESPSNIDRLNFKKRKELCRSLAKKMFENSPNVLAVLSKILGDSADLHWRRNFVVHGRLKTTLYVTSHGNPSRGIPPKIDANISVSSRHNGQQKTLTVTTGGMEKLFYDIGYALGRLIQFSTPDTQVPGLSSFDKDQLRNFLVSNHPNLPSRSACTPASTISGVISTVESAAL